MIDDQILDCFGFDLGDGESAVAWANAESDAGAIMLEIAGRKSTLTALGYHGDQPRIGEAAYLSDPDRLYVRFKRRFIREPHTVAKRIEAFAACVLDELAKTGKLADPRAAAFFIGCPSGWPDETRENYRRCFEDAGFPNVSIISESRAAFLFACESGELRLPKAALDQPALILDTGSSTMDFTFVSGHAARSVFDFGENALGGGLIDHLLLEHALRKSPNEARLRQVFKACPQYEARCELEARRIKELYFARASQTGADLYAVPCETQVKVYYEKPIITLDIACDDAIMREVLQAPLPEQQGAGFEAACRASLERARQALADTPPERILLTGGASRMGFLQALVRSVFPNAELLLGAEPEFSIARGLLYALRVDLRTDRFEREVRALLDADAVENLVSDALPALLDALAPVVTEQLVERIAPASFARWKRGELQTIGDMSRDIGAFLNADLASGALRDALSPVLLAWLERLRPALERLTDPICERAHLPLTSLRLPSGEAACAGDLHIDPDQMFDLSLIQNLVDLAVGAIVAALLGGGGVALLMAGPVGLIVSFAIGFVASRLGTTLAKKHVDRINLPVLLRSFFSEALFRRTLKNRSSELTQSLREQLQTLSPQSADSLRTSLSSAVEAQLRGMADEARIRIR